MALIEVGAGVYYNAFATGNGDGPTYTDYAPDLDTNFTTLMNAVNRIWTRLQSMVGSNTQLIEFVTQLDDPDGPLGELNYGTVGEHAYKLSINADTTKLDCTKGPAVRAGQLVNLLADVVIDGTGVIASGSGWIYLSWDVNGGVVADDISSGNDFARYWWNGSNFTGNPERLVPVFMDGDAWYDLKTTPSTCPAFPAKTYETPDDRVASLERLLSGYVTNLLGDTIGPLQFPPGAYDDPQVCFSDGAGAEDNAGWYRGAANEWRWTTGSAEIMRLHSQGIRFAIAGSASQPLVQLNDVDSGLYWDTDGPAMSSNATKSMKWLSGQALFEVGTEGSPGLAIDGDPDTGFYQIGANELGASTGGSKCFGLDAYGNLDLPLNGRVRTLASSQSVTGSGTGTTSNIAFAAEDYDVSGWHDNATNNDRHTCPTGYGGIYHVRGTVRFLESTAGGAGGANVGDYRLAQITVNGSAVDHAATLVPPTGATAALDTILTVDETLALAAADIVRLACDHDNGGTMNVEAEFSIEKVA